MSSIVSPYELELRQTDDLGTLRRVITVANDIRARVDVMAN